MLWKGRRQSDNFEDLGRGGGGGRIIGGGIGAIVIAIIIYFLGGDPSQVLQQVNQAPQQNNAPLTAEEKDRQEFVRVVLAETEDVWNKILPEQTGVSYKMPRLNTFQQRVLTACGGASSASGPFYCPADQEVYIDLSFYDELQQRFHATGDFAMAYVVSHEVGHHIQNLLGISEKVQKLRGQLSQTEYNKLSVKLELQADFLAGVWAHHTQQMKNIIEPGDIEEALNAANAIGDDKLQQQTRGEIVPDAFTHGTSAQRMYWFKKGYETGDIRQGDTFASDDL